MNKREQSRAYAIARYRDNLRTLRRNFTGFEARNGYRLDKPTVSARRSVEGHRQKVRLLKQVDTYPHRTLERSKVSKKVFAAAQTFAPVTLEKTRLTTRRKTRTVRHQAKQVVIFTVDPKARISVAKDGALRIREQGRIRDVYKFSAEKLQQKPEDLYTDIKTFMGKKRATNITFNLGANVIGLVYKKSDFDPTSTTARFVNMVSRYRHDQHISKFQNFMDAFNGISVYRGRRRGAEITTREIDAARKRARVRRKQTRRALMIGRI